MASVVPADQPGGRRTAEGISVDSDKMMRSCTGWFYFTNFFGFLFSGDIKKKKESIWWSCPVGNIPPLEAAGSAPLTAPAELQSKPAVRAAARPSLLRLCLSKPVIGVFMLQRGPSDSWESTEPLPPPSAESALVQWLRPGCTSLNHFDETVFQIAMTERFCQQCSWRCLLGKNQVPPLKKKDRKTNNTLAYSLKLVFPERHLMTDNSLDHPSIITTQRHRFDNRNKAMAA